MSSKKITSIIIIVFLLIAIIYATNKLSNNSSETKDLEKVVDFYEKIQNETNNTVLNNFFVINQNKDTLLISDLLTTSKKIIYRFSELHCDVCINHEFENLKKCIEARKIKAEDLIIISSYNNIKNLYVFKRINKLQNFEVYNLTNNSIGNFELDDFGYPYFFTLSKDLKISNTLIPIKSNSKRTNDYLEGVLSK